MATWDLLRANIGQLGVVGPVFALFTVGYILGVWMACLVFRQPQRPYEDGVPATEEEDFLARMRAGGGTRLPVVVLTVKNLAPRGDISARDGGRDGRSAQAGRRPAGRSGLDRRGVGSRPGGRMRTRIPPGLQILQTVLIADDESSMRLLVHATIESDDYTVVEAADGAEAWAMIQERKPSLVLLDVQMPGRSGLEVLRLVKEDPSLVATRVILLTS